MTAADRPSVTDNARAEALEQGIRAFIRHGQAVPADVTTYDREAVHADLLTVIDRANRAAGRAETTAGWGGYRVKWDVARAEADPYLVDRHLAHVEAAVEDYRTVYPEPRALSANLSLAVEGARLLAAGRAETTTATDEDAARVIDALGRHWWSTQTGETEPWDDLTDDEKANVVENAYIDVLVTPVLDLLATASTGDDTIRFLVRQYDRLVTQMIEALGLDPDRDDDCVPECEDGPGGSEHLLWHLIQRATARTRPTETEWGVRSPSGGVTPWGPREISARRHANESGHALVRREVTAWTEADQ